MKMIAVTLILLFCSTVGADEVADLSVTTAEAQRLYQEQEFQAAADIYAQLLTTGNVSAELHYNLANCYFRLEKFGPSRLNFEKAHRLSPQDQDIRHNISFLENQLLKESLHERHLSSIDRFLWNSVIIFPPAFSVPIALICYLSIGLLIILRMLKFKVSLAFFWSVVILAALIGAGSFVAAATFETLQSAESYAIIIVPDAAISSEPGNDAPGSFPAPQAMKVRILRQQQDWLEIQLPNGSKGWIISSAVGII
jgi:tetratricopeptide (TPR) repeat protein